MENIEIIKLGIAGNPYSNGGHQPLVGIGYEEEELKKDIIFPEAVKSDYLIEFVQNDKVMKYTYVAKPSTVHSYGASRGGSLWISITITKGWKIENFTPYTLLLHICKLFRDTYMTPRSDGSYEFRPVSCDRSVFIREIEKLNIVKDDGRYIEMKGDRPGAVSTGDKITEFFDDPQYDVFKDFSKIIVAENIDGSKIKVDIPRQVNYIVYYQKKDTIKEQIGKPIQSKSAVFEYLFQSPDEWHEAVDVKFTLNTLKDNEESAKNYRVTVDNISETVTIYDISFPAKTKTMTVKIDNQSDVKTDDLNFQFTSDDKVIGTRSELKGNNSYSFEFKGEEIQYAKLENLKWSGKEGLEIKKGLQEETICVTVTQKPEVKSITLYYTTEIDENAKLHLTLEDGSEHIYKLKNEKIGILSVSLEQLHILKRDIKDVMLQSDNYIYRTEAFMFNSDPDLKYNITESEQKQPTATADSSAKSTSEENQQPEKQALTITNDTNTALNKVTVRYKEQITEKTLNTCQSVIDLPTPEISEVEIEFADDNHTRIIKKVSNNGVTLEEGDLKSGNGQNSKSGKIRLIALLVAVIILAVTLTCIILVGRHTSTDEMTQVENILKVIPDIKPKTQTTKIYTLENWDDIFEKYSKVKNSSGLGVKESLDSAKSVIDKYKKDHEDALKKKGHKKIKRKLEGMENSYSKKLNNFQSLQVQANEQIDRFAELMKELKIEKENDNYILLFDDVYKIQEWRDNEKTCNIVDTTSANYKYVHDNDTLFVDFVKILVKNNLKTNLNHKEKYQDKDDKYTIKSKDGFNQKTYADNNPIRDIYSKSSNDLRTKNKTVLDDTARNKFLYLTNNSTDPRAKKQQQLQEKLILIPLRNKTKGSFDDINSFNDITLSLAN